MSWAKFKSFANQFLEDASSASSLALGGGRQALDIGDHWVQVRTFFRDANNHPNPAKMAERLADVEAELEKIISLLLEERPRFLRCMEDSALPMPKRFDYLLGGTASAADAVVDEIFDSNPEREDGKQLITTVCQFAKHDIPQGSRAIVLRFLTRLFRDVDSDAGRCLLHYNNDFIAMPLLDAVERIFNILNPWLASKSKPSSEASGRAPRTLQVDRREFVALLQTLSAKVENIPSVAAIFMIKGPSRGGTATKPTDAFAAGDGSPQRSSAEQNAPRLLLIEGLVPFIQDSVVDLPDLDRIGTTRRALAGILSIARTADPILREMLVNDTRVVTVVTQELCQALVTACTVPINSEHALNVAFVCDAVSFLDAVVLATPYVAKTWQIRNNKFVGSFLRGALRMLLVSVDDGVYAKTANILSLILQTQSIRSEPLRESLANFLFEHDPDLAGSTGEVLEDLEAHLAHASGAPSQPIPSLFETAILPRMSSMNDIAVAATLALIRVLIEQLPAPFMRHVLNISTPFKIPSAVLELKKDVAQGPQNACRPSPQPSPSALVPVLKVEEYFPRSIVSAKGLCESTTAVFANDVLRRLLLVESMLSGEAGEVSYHQPSFDDANELLFLDLDKDSIPTDVAGKERLKRRLAAAHLDTGVFCLPKLNTNAFIAALCSKFSTFTEHSAAVNMELTGVASSLCLLPDYRIFYTLFDIGRRGALALVLQQKANQIEEAIHADKERCTKLNKDPSLIVTSKATLIKALFAKKDPFEDKNNSQGGVKGAGEWANAILSAPGAAGQHQDPHHGLSAKAGVNNDRETRLFVEACVLLEGFRHEMLAITGQVEVSLKLMELTT